MGDVVSFPEPAGRLPSTIYAIKVRGKDTSGKKFSRIHFFASLVTYRDLMAQIDKYADGLDVQTYEGKVEWTH